VADPRAARALREHGADAVSFQGLESGMSWWHAPQGNGAAALAYHDTGRSWIAAGGPLAASGQRAQAAADFAAAARSAGRRPVFFGVESLEPFPGMKRLQLGLQSALDPAQWQDTLRRSAKLREQLRRARAKGVTIRVVAAEELVPGAPLRALVAALAQAWLGSRRMEPMAFLVSVEPFHEPHEHVYLAAEHRGALVQFLSVVPIYARSAWLIEDMLRGRSAPNGTTELLIDRLMREVGPRSSFITPGLTPLTGALPPWLAAARFALRPLYDFDGLRRFRARLLPARWEPVWMAWDRGAAPLVLLDVLRAFAGGHLLGFGWRTLVRRANGPPFALALPLVAWTAALALLAAAGRQQLLGFGAPALWAWVVYDLALLAMLFRAASRPSAARLLAVTAMAALDAALSMRHLAVAGLGGAALPAALRLAATAGPVLGTLGLALTLLRLRKS
jgi:phosphatidylglycerol lysyltransferase